MQNKYSKNKIKNIFIIKILQDNKSVNSIKNINYNLVMNQPLKIL